METRAHYVIVGTFVITVLIGIVISVVWLARLQFQREGAIYDIYFRGSVSGLNDGAPVNYNGVPIGRVVSIRLDSENVERIRVRIVVDVGIPIKQDAVASLETQGITGQAFVQISGGTNASPPAAIPEGRSYPVIASRQSQLQEALTSAPQLLNSAIGVADRLTLVLDDQNRGALAHTLNNIEVLTGALAKRSQDIDQVIVDATATMVELRGMATHANTALDRFSAELNDKGGISDKLNTTLDEFSQSAKALGQISGHLDGMLQENRGALHDFSQRGLSEAEKLIVDSRALVAELNRIADQLDRDPARFLFGNRREGYQPR
jgi:phospholipid/cholesterol/gamma-HCH transport system substrate-binding protein